ncbi:MAG: TrkH family potassium uptake protein [Actinomycetota bacterium]|nr:TrkH family potassium uptake protein [Actinomycetota bacterium]
MSGWLGHPVRLVPLAFLVAIAVGAVLLMLPVAHRDDGAVLLPALFTSVSSVCVTGLTTVDTAEHWTPFGQAVILGLVQVGGFGIMTLATLLGLLMTGRLGLRGTLTAQVETHAVNLGDVRSVLRRVAVTMASFEAVVAVVLTARFRAAYDDGLATAAWHGLFHAVSAFNNAGFALYSDNLIGFVGDPWVMLPISAAVVAGGIGFPVLAELFRHLGRPTRWSVHTRITVWGTALLLVVGIGSFLLFEWGNAGTIGGLGAGEKVVAGVTGGVMPRTAGFNSVDYAQITPETMSIQYVLMFIGGGSAGTAGGIKVTTFFLLAYVIWAEVQAERDVVVGHRRVGSAATRQALSVALLGVAVVAAGTLAILVVTDLALDVVLFEAISAFATVGLSVGITPSLPWSAQVVLMLLMFVGRVGTITVASAFAMRSRHRLYHLPEERPIVG